MAWLDVATEAFFVIYYSLLWMFFTALYLVVKILQFTALPIHTAWKVLRFVLAPVTYTLRLVFSPVSIIVNSMPRLMPLYIYFGSAVFIGLLFGLLLSLTTSTTFSLFNLYDDTSSPSRNAPKHADEDPPGTPDTTRSRNDSTTSEGTRKDLDALLAGISSQESDRQLIAALQGGGVWRDPANAKRKRRSVGGAGGAGHFGTILEEDDDSL